MSFKHLTRKLPLTLDTKQLNKLKKHSDKTGLVFDVDKLSEIYSFWVENIAIPTHIDKNRKLINQTQTIAKVLLNDAPDLMFVNVQAMKQRFKKFLELGFVNNMDKLHTFSHSPYGWYLQDWNQFSMKFSFIQYRIMPWLLANEDDPWPEPHPLIRACKVLELPYEHIKSRFLWIKSAGIGPSKLNDDAGDLLNYSNVLNNLLLTNTEYFVKSATPGTSKVEYDFFEKMITHNETIEDSIMSCLNDLTSHGQSNLLLDHEDEDIRELAAVEYKKLK